MTAKGPSKDVPYKQWKPARLLKGLVKEQLKGKVNPERRTRIEMGSTYLY